MEEKEFEWLSVSEVAKRVGRSKQTIYNWCAKGRYEIKSFKRGQMAGLLVKFPI